MPKKPKKPKIVRKRENTVGSCWACVHFDRVSQCLMYDMVVNPQSHPGCFCVEKLRPFVQPGLEYVTFP